MSLGGGKSESLNKVVNSIVETIDITIVTASGNSIAWACNGSPGSAGKNINVGAHDLVIDGESCSKPPAFFSNFGTCVDVMAPGVRILSAAMNTVNGNSYIYIYISRCYSDDTELVSPDQPMV